MSLQPGKEGEAGQAIGDKYGSAIPWVAVVRAIGRAVDFGGGGASRKDRERFRAAGGSIVHQGKGRWKFTYQGQRVSERKAIKIGRQGGLPGGGGGSIADRPLPSGSTYDYRIWQYLQWLWQPRGPRKLRPVVGQPSPSLLILRALRLFCVDQASLGFTPKFLGGGLVPHDSILKASFGPFAAPGNGWVHNWNNFFSAREASDREPLKAAVV